MAIKLSGSVSRKAPIPGIEFSSESYSAGLEIEINSSDPATIQAQLTQLYATLSQGIDAQIVAAHPSTTTLPSLPPPSPAPEQIRQPVPQQRNGYVNGTSRNRLPAANGNGTGRRVNATEAQCRAIFAICKSQGLDMASVLAQFNVTDPKDLHVKDASRCIDQLKQGAATQQ